MSHFKEEIIPKIIICFFLFSPVENQNDRELDFKVVFFFFVDSYCSCLILDEPTDATLASLSVLNY